MDFFDRIGLSIYLAMLALVGGILGMINNNKFLKCDSVSCVLFTFVVGAISSVYVGYISYHIAFYYSQSEKYSFAIASIAAWIGTDAMLIVKANIVEFLKSKLGVKKDIHPEVNEEELK